jgi:hypothetical protein
MTVTTTHVTAEQHTLTLFKASPMHMSVCCTRTARAGARMRTFQSSSTGQWTHDVGLLALEASHGGNVSTTRYLDVLLHLAFDFGQVLKTEHFSGVITERKSNSHFGFAFPTIFPALILTRMIKWTVNWRALAILKTLNVAMISVYRMTFLRAAVTTCHSRGTQLIAAAIRAKAPKVARLS